MTFICLQILQLVWLAIIAFSVVCGQNDGRYRPTNVAKISGGNDGRYNFNTYYRVVFLVKSFNFTYNMFIRYRPMDDGRYRPSNDGTYTNDGEKYEHKDVKYVHSDGKSGTDGGGGGVGNRKTNVNNDGVVQIGSRSGIETFTENDAVPSIPKPTRPTVSVANLFPIPTHTAATPTNRGEGPSGWKTIRQEQTEDVDGYHYL